MTKRTLTRKQSKVLSAIREFLAVHGYPPSMRELASDLGLTVGTAHFHVHSLMDRGYLVHDGTDHGLRLLDGGTGSQLPLLGCIVAGQPLELSQESGESIDVPESLAIRASYALRVRGESMKEDGIHDGDYVIVRQQDDVENGEIGVVMLPDGGMTLKRVYRENGGYRLQPANQEMEPIRVPRIRVQGRVLGLIRVY